MRCVARKDCSEDDQTDLAYDILISILLFEIDLAIDPVFDVFKQWLTLSRGRRRIAIFREIYLNG